MSLALLFTALTLLFAGICALAATGGSWPVAVAAAAIAVWMSSLALSSARRALRKRRL